MVNLVQSYELILGGHENQLFLFLTQLAAVLQVDRYRGYGDPPFTYSLLTLEITHQFLSLYFRQVIVPNEQPLKFSDLQSCR